MWTITIGEGTQEFSFSSPRTKFTPSMSNSYKAGGDVLDSTTLTMAIRGIVSGTDATTIAAWKEMRDVVQRTTPQRLRIYRDATLEIDLKPSELISGPNIQSFVVDDADGTFGAYYKFSMDVVAVTQASGEFEEDRDATNVRRLIETEHHNKELVRKEWRAVAEGDNALALVTSFKPQGVEPLTEIVTEEIDEKRSTVRYIYQPKQDDLRVQEELVLVPGGRPIVPVLVVPGAAKAGNPPLLFRGRRRAYTLTLTGRITSKDDTIEAPKNHFKEDFLDETQSRRDFEPRLVEPNKKIYEVAYTEVYVFEKLSDLGKPNHSDHAALLKSVKEPGDGAINP